MIERITNFITSPEVMFFVLSAVFVGFVGGVLDAIKEYNENKRSKQSGRSN